MTQDKDYLLTLRSVRERCFKVQEMASKNQLRYFDIDPPKLEDAVDIVVSLIKCDYPNLPNEAMPAHGRWRHFDVGGRPRIDKLIKSYKDLDQDPMEQTRRVLDLFVVACLLDFDVGHTWTYVERTTGKSYNRTEGVAVAVLELFTAGAFSSDPYDPHRVDSEALSRLTLDTLRRGLQVDDKQHELVDLEDRHALLQHLGQVLRERNDFFGSGTVARPGNLMDYLLNHSTTIKTKKGPLILLETLWPVVQEMGELWMATKDKGGTQGLGDVWPCATIQKAGADSTSSDHFVAFHTMSQWLVYSLIEPMERLLGATIEGTDQLTALPDYYNGGLLLDTGFLTLKELEYERGLDNYRQNSHLPGQSKVEVTPMFDMADPVVVEWRALTTAYLDVIAERVRDHFKLKRDILPLSKLIEGGTLNAGRELAMISRPLSRKPPIVIKSASRIIY